MAEWFKAPVLKTGRLTPRKFESCPFRQKIMKNKRGFTVLEIIIVGAFAGLALILFFVQKSNVDAMNRDEKRKAAINAMYYALEEGYYPAKNGYPEEISEKILTIIDPALFTDPLGFYIGTDFSSYSYEATNCKDGLCKEYTLRAELEKEDDYIKKNRN